ncbi:MAG: hypothetical protein L6Q73_18360 [Aquabacterium sp.]|nr:hypothetical protein [Aquabacterium sp.]
MNETSATIMSTKHSTENLTLTLHHETQSRIATQELRQSARLVGAAKTDAF